MKINFTSIIGPKIRKPNLADRETGKLAAMNASEVLHKLRTNAKIIIRPIPVVSF